MNTQKKVRMIINKAQTRRKPKEKPLKINKCSKVQLTFNKQNNSYDAELKTEIKAENAPKVVVISWLTKERYWPLLLYNWNQLVYPNKEWIIVSNLKIDNLPDGSKLVTKDPFKELNYEYYFLMGEGSVCFPDTLSIKIRALLSHKKDLSFVYNVGYYNPNGNKSFINYNICCLEGLVFKKSFLDYLIKKEIKIEAAYLPLNTAKDWEKRSVILPYFLSHITFYGSTKVPEIERVLQDQKLNFFSIFPDVVKNMIEE